MSWAWALRRLALGGLCVLLATLLLASLRPARPSLGAPGSRPYTPPTRPTQPSPKHLQAGQTHSRVDPTLKVLKTHLAKATDPHSFCDPKLDLAARWKDKYEKKFFVKNSWEYYFAGISTCYSYDGSRWDSVVWPLLQDLRTAPITAAKIFGEGTQVKLLLTFHDGLQANFKPKRFDRDFETDPNHFYFSDFERHNAEIAAFHLDRVLGLNRAIPTTMRIVNLRTEVLPVAHPKLNKTFFVSPSENLCFVAKCDYYCDTTHAICGKPVLKEGMVQVWLPDEDYVKRHEYRSPYKRTYSKHDPDADWQKDDTYCTNVVHGLRDYAHGRALPDLVETHIFDFLIGNQDRHHHETYFDYFKVQSAPLFLDQGRGFGRSYWDDLDILKPLTQCCLIRPGFLARLLEIYFGPKPLSTLVKESIREVEPESVLPILAEKHYIAMDRRLTIILKAVKTCIDDKGVSDVIKNEFHNPDLEEGDGKSLESSKSS